MEKLEVFALEVFCYFADFGERSGDERRLLEVYY